MVAHLDAVTCLAVDPNGVFLMSGSKLGPSRPLRGQGHVPSPAGLGTGLEGVLQGLPEAGELAGSLSMAGRKVVTASKAGTVIPITQMWKLI